MTGLALDVLNTIRRHGGDVKLISPDRLKVMAPRDLLPNFVTQVRAVKPEMIAELAATSCPADPVAQVGTPARNGPLWRHRFTVRTFQWLVGRRDLETAKRLAWGDLQNEWHERYGRRWPARQCAGCGEPLGGLDLIELPDGNRVHLEPIDCLITFGNRWRAEADQALSAFGLQSPIGPNPRPQEAEQRSAPHVNDDPR
jgi:hypothetical protein